MNHANTIVAQTITNVVLLLKEEALTVTLASACIVRVSLAAVARPDSFLNGRLPLRP
jgi:hypothetical protein